MSMKIIKRESTSEFYKNYPYTMLDTNNGLTSYDFKTEQDADKALEALYRD